MIKKLPGSSKAPYPEQSTQTLHTAVEKAKIGQREQTEALKRLTLWGETTKDEG